MLVLLGIAVLVAGFAARLNPLLVVVAAALATGVLAAIHPGVWPDPAALWAALKNTVSALGKAFQANRFITAVWLILPVIGLLEREGLQERARKLMGGIKAATVGRLLIVYFLVRQITAAVGLTTICGQAQTVRPLIAPMAEGAAESRYGPLPDKVRFRIRAWAAATDNTAVFFGEDLFLAVASILVIVGMLKASGIDVSPFQLSVWAIPTAVCAFIIHTVRLLRLDRSLKRELGATATTDDTGETPQ